MKLNKEKILKELGATIGQAIDAIMETYLPDISELPRGHKDVQMLYSSICIGEAYYGSSNELKQVSKIFKNPQEMFGSQWDRGVDGGKVSYCLIREYVAVSINEKYKTQISKLDLEIYEDNSNFLSQPREEESAEANITLLEEMGVNPRDIAQGALDPVTSSVSQMDSSSAARRLDSNSDEMFQRAMRMSLQDSRQEEDDIALAIEASLRHQQDLPDDDFDDQEIENAINLSLRTQRQEQDDIARAAKESLDELSLMEAVRQQKLQYQGAIRKCYSECNFEEAIKLKGELQDLINSFEQ